MMKKKFSILITITLILNIAIQLFVNISFARANNQTEDKKKNSESYWSTKNAPMFYGTTKITLQKGIIDNFDILDSRFRIFAKDFEDGDLTPNITHSGEVKVNEVGNYEITYTVTDSHKNTTTLVVPVIVTEEENTKIIVERTIYTTPSVWNMDLAEFSRCNYGDRQILGVYLANNQSIKARIISSESALDINFFNNDKYTESSKTIPITGEWITLENTVGDIGYESVPLLRTKVLTIVVYNTLTNTVIPEYKAIDTITRYKVIENGIMREDMTEENAEDVAYEQLKVHLINIIETYQQKVTEEELQNKRVNYEEKTVIISAYNQLREKDKVPYTSLINSIKRGGIPQITVIAQSLEYDKGIPIDLYTLITAIDNEDGIIVVNKNSTVVKTDLNNI